MHIRNILFESVIGVDNLIVVVHILHIHFIGIDNKADETPRHGEVSSHDSSLSVQPVRSLLIITVPVTMNSTSNTSSTNLN